MRIEQLENDESSVTIGITSFQNSNQMTQNELITLASSLSNGSITIQLLNGLLIADENHLLSATQNAINAKNGNYMRSRSLDVEIIVFASAQRQIGKALDALGVFDGLSEIAVVVVGPDSESVMEKLQSLSKAIGNEIIPPFAASEDRIERIKDHYEITDKEIEAILDSDKLESKLSALSRCIVSRVSLVAFDN
ncbi:MAG: KEOPS complex subunit Cgi121 [Candidatus Thorarchaeota archaeon]